MFGKYFRHNRQEQFMGIQYFILFFKISKETAVFIVSGKISHILGARSLSFKKTVSFRHLLRVSVDVVVTSENMLDIKLDAGPFIILKIYVASICCFLSCISNWAIFSKEFLKSRSVIAMYSL